MSGSGQPAGLARPGRLVPGTELLGRYQGSGTADEAYLVRRPDGRMVQLSRLLYLVTGELDGHRTSAEVATAVSSRIGRRLAPADVEVLVARKLLPLGLVEDPDGQPPRRPHLLGLAARRRVIPSRVVRSTTSVLQHLFHAPVVAGVVTALVAADVWIVASGHVADSLAQVVGRADHLLLAIVLTVLAGGFHELGHAAASRHGGAEPGEIGVGIYLIWPAFFNDMNDTYRLGRGARVRADLGGVYFNAVLMVVLVAAYAVTGFGPLLGVVVAHHLLVAQQFLPFVRLDGYYLVSDLAGVPDLFAYVRPVLSRLRFWRPPQPWPQRLQPGARAAVTAWVVVSVPLLLGCLGLLVLGLPRLLGQAVAGVESHARAVADALAGGDLVTAAVGMAALTVYAVPLVGLALLVIRLAGSRWRRWPLELPNPSPPPGPSPVLDVSYWGVREPAASGSGTALALDGRSPMGVMP